MVIMLRVFLFLCLIATSAAQTVFDPVGLKELDEVVEAAVAKKNPAGAVLWLEHRGQAHRIVKGERELVPVREPMLLETIFDAASLTKVIATTPCVMILMDQGKLELEAPVCRYLPEFQGEGRELIRLRHLLTHTSSLKPGIPSLPSWVGYQEGIRRAVTSIPEAVPDSFFRYSDINFILLGEIVRRVSGEALDTFAHKEIYLPLKMTSTRFTPPADWRSRIAPTERDELGAMLQGVVHDPTSRRMGGVTGHAGLFTTAADLAQYARMILGGGQLEGKRVIKAETIAQMSQVQSAATVLERRGLGWDIDSPYSRPRGTVFPMGSFGHTGFTGTSLWIDPTSQSFVIFLSSRLHPDGGGSVRDLYELVGTAAGKCIPGFDFQHVSGALAKRAENEVPTVLNGIDVLQRDGFAALKGLHIGLITNHTGINTQRRSTIDLLHESKELQLRALFSPEHGIRGEQDQEKITDSKDAKSGLPVFSLYGESRAPKPEQLAELDALVFDIQDIGCRFYTYISTLRLSMEAAAKAGKKFIVLDRVNPIGGIEVEGPAVVDKETFTATHAIPIRHGMTVGELAQMMNVERKIGADLQVIRVQGWRREWFLDQTGLPWLNPSPNMRTLEAALLYPGVGLLEFSISVGRGTDTPFQILGAPYIDDLRFSHELNKLGLPGLRFMPVRFKPTASVFKEEVCGGVRLVITDRAALNPVTSGMAMATVLQRLYPKAFALEKVNTLLNHAKLLESIRSGKEWRSLQAMWGDETAGFMAKRGSYLLY
jgi:uncharacterized protein YbbC (DUF1343 family)/CubicO group peptidase (beta-lactamase class C family)